MKNYRDLEEEKNKIEEQFHKLKERCSNLVK